MRSIYQPTVIAKFVQQYKILDYFSVLPNSLHIVEYEPGETIFSAFDSGNSFQILIKGNASIVYSRENGSIFSLAQCKAPDIIGEIELFFEQNPHIIVTAQTNCTCISISIEEDRNTLLNDVVFMRTIAGNLAKKLQTLTNLDAKSHTLAERVINYMTYYCKDRTLFGVENSAFHLHCSPRQLQRVLNELVSKNQIKKIGKGKYQLL